MRNPIRPRGLRGRSDTNEEHALPPIAERLRNLESYVGEFVANDYRDRGDVTFSFIFNTGKNLRLFSVREYEYQTHVDEKGFRVFPDGTYPDPRQRALSDISLMATGCPPELQKILGDWNLADGITAPNAELLVPFAEFIDKIARRYEGENKARVNNIYDESEWVCNFPLTSRHHNLPALSREMMGAYGHEGREKFIAILKEELGMSIQNRNEAKAGNEGGRVLLDQKCKPD